MKVVAARYELAWRSLYEHLGRCVRNAMGRAKQAMEHMREWRALVAPASLTAYEGRALMLSIKAEGKDDFNASLRGTELAASIHHKRVGLDAPLIPAAGESEQGQTRVEIYIPVNSRG